MEADALPGHLVRERFPEGYEAYNRRRPKTRTVKGREFFGHICKALTERAREVAGGSGTLQVHLAEIRSLIDALCTLEKINRSTIPVTPFEQLRERLPGEDRRSALFILVTKLKRRVKAMCRYEGGGSDDADPHEKETLVKHVGVALDTVGLISIAMDIRNAVAEIIRDRNDKIGDYSKGVVYLPDES